MNKVIYIEAPFKPILEDISVSIPTGEVKRGLFGGEKEVTRKERKLVQTGVSDSKIDGKTLSVSIDQAISELNNEGYDIISITPITSGSYDYREISSSVRVMGGTEMMDGGAWGYGFSFTSGVLLLGKKHT